MFADVVNDFLYMPLWVLCFKELNEDFNDKEKCHQGLTNQNLIYLSVTELLQQDAAIL